MKIKDFRRLMAPRTTLKQIGTSAEDELMRQNEKYKPTQAKLITWFKLKHQTRFMKKAGKLERRRKEGNIKWTCHFRLKVISWVWDALISRHKHFCLFRKRRGAWYRQIHRLVNFWSLTPGSMTFRGHNPGGI